MESSTALSQVAHFEKPTGQRKNGKNAVNSKAETLLLKSFALFDPPNETKGQRYKLYLDYLNTIQETVEGLEEDWNNKLVEQVQEFMHESIKRFKLNEIVTPVGFVPSGLSGDESRQMFNKIGDEIKEQVVFLAKISYATCPNVKLAFQTICKQLLRSNLDVSHVHDITAGADSEDDLEGTFDGEERNTKKQSEYLSVHDLQKWYEKKCPKYFENPLFRNSPSLGQARQSINRTRHKSTDYTDPMKTPRRSVSPLERRSKSPVKVSTGRNENESPDTTLSTTSVKSELEFELDELELINKTSGQSQKPKKTTSDSQRMLRSTPNKLSPKHRSERVLRSTPNKMSPEQKNSFSTPKSILKVNPLSAQRNSSIADISPLVCTNSSSNAHYLTTPSAKRANASRNYPGLSTPTPTHSLTLVTTPKSSVRFQRLERLQLTRRSLLRKPELIAIIVENADLFAPNVIPQLLHLLSSSKLPFVLIFGVNHCLSNLNRFIPTGCSTAFVYKTFNIVPPGQKLNIVISKIIRDNKIPFMLGSSVMQYLSKYFNNQHFSFKRLLQAYQICLINHFRKPESIFCTNDNSWGKVLSQFEEGEIQISLELFGKATFDTRRKRLKDCQFRIQNWIWTLNLVFCIKRAIGNSSVSLRELYIECASGMFFDISSETKQSSFEVFLNELRGLLKPGMQELLEEIDTKFCEQVRKKVLNGGDDKSILNSSVDDLVTALTEYFESFKQIDADEKNEVETENTKTKPRLRKKMNLQELKNELQDNIQSKQGSKVFLNFRQSYVDSIAKIVKANLKSLSSLESYSKVFVYDDVLQLKMMFSPDPQLCITNSLSLPGPFLQCECCREVGFHAIDPSLPDSSVVFKLLKEQTHKKLDLNLLYDSFLSIVEVSETSSKRRKTEANEDSYLMRFRQAIAELQFHGVLKRTKSKPDEVNKLIWL